MFFGSRALSDLRFHVGYWHITAPGTQEVDRSSLQSPRDDFEGAVALSISPSIRNAGFFSFVTGRRHQPAMAYGARIYFRFRRGTADMAGLAAVSTL
jgi:hypothetical protein